MSADELRGVAARIVSEANLSSMDRAQIIAQCEELASALLEPKLSPFRLLDSPELVRLVTDLVGEDDALCAALVCRTWRAAIFDGDRFPVRPPHKRLRTQWAAFLCSELRFRWAVEHGGCLRWGDILCTHAAKRGDTATLRWLRGAKFPWDYDTSKAVFVGACAGGQLGVLKHHLREGDMKSLAAAYPLTAEEVCPCPWAEAGKAAASGGHYQVLMHLCAQLAQYGRRKLGGKSFYLSCCEGAGESGQSEVVQWVLTTLAELMSDSLDDGAANHYLCTAIKAAAQAGQWEWLRQCLSEYAGWMPFIISHTPAVVIASAAQVGNLPMLTWLQAQAQTSMHPLHMSKLSTLMQAAARHGQIHVLEWACANGGVWELEAAQAAIVGGQLQVLQWAHEKQLPWFVEVWDACLWAQSGPRAVEMLRWAHGAGMPGWRSGETFMKRPPHSTALAICVVLATWNRFEMLEYLNEVGCFRPPLEIAVLARYVGLEGRKRRLDTRPPCGPGPKKEPWETFYRVHAGEALPTNAGGASD